MEVLAAQNFDGYFHEVEKSREVGSNDSSSVDFQSKFDISELDLVAENAN